MNAIALPGRRTAAFWLACFVFAGLPALPAVAQDCRGSEPCIENPRFSATLSDFRVLQTGTKNRPLAATLRLRNKTGAPLTLVYVSGSAVALDDQGTRYTMPNTRTGLRGLGAATRQSFDPRFTLAPGEAGDARIEVTAFVKGIHGTRFDLELALREVEPLPGGQQRLGRETLLRYTGLRDGVAAARPAAAAANGGAAPGDACQGRPGCVVNGALAAHVERLAPEAVKGNNQGIVVGVVFHNRSAEPMILNYKQDTGVMLDELGQRYTVDSRRRSDVQGIPVSTRERASSQFTLAPGESRRAQFRYTRFVGKTRIGTRFTPSLAVEQYELLPSNQLRLQREYALDFGAQGAAGGGMAAGTAEVQQLLDTLGGLLKR